jgi:hypothetical protein
MSRVGTLLVVVLLLAGTLVLAPGGVGPVRAAGAASDPVLMATDGSILDSGSDTCSPASGGSNPTTNTT